MTLIPQLTEIFAPDPDDACYTAPIPALTFNLNGKDIFIVPETMPDDVYNDLKRQITPHSRVAELERMPFGLYRCVLVNSDGTRVKTFIDDEGIYANILAAEEATRTLCAEMVC
jgi:hypothetical protein